jgi:hypothetical protein
MPLPPLPDNNTHRVWLDYTANNHGHTLMTRWAVNPNTIIPEIEAFHEAFLNNLTTFRVTNWAFVGARYALVDSDLSFPFAISPTITPGTASTGAFGAAMSLNFIGRTVGGRRTRWSVFGVSIPDMGGDYRLTIAENANVELARLVLISAIGTGLVGIDGLTPTIYPYANVSVNAYWQRQTRE